MFDDFNITKYKLTQYPSDISLNGLKIVREIVAAMKNSMVLHISVAGHTDSLVIRARAKDVFKDNYELSEARAESVGDYLMDILDLELDQLSFSGEGADYPIASNDTEEGRARNRRVELKVESEKLISWIEMEQDATR